MPGLFLSNILSPSSATRITAAAVDFFVLLTGPELLEMTDSLLPAHRERFYLPTQVLAMFMG